MWDIEVNIANHRFAHQISDRRRRFFAPLPHRAWHPSVMREHVRHLLFAA